MYLLRKLFLFIGLLSVTATSAIADTSSIVIDAQSGNVLYADNAENKLLISCYKDKKISIFFA